MTYVGVTATLEITLDTTITNTNLQYTEPDSLIVRQIDTQAKICRYVYKY